MIENHLSVRAEITVKKKRTTCPVEIEKVLAQSDKYRKSYFKKYIIDFDKINVKSNIYAAISTPDKDRIPNSENLSPAYLIFTNYELILKWNRSLRFALAVCTLKNEFKNAL